MMFPFKLKITTHNDKLLPVWAKEGTLDIRCQRIIWIKKREHTRRGMNCVVYSVKIMTKKALLNFSVG